MNEASWAHFHSALAFSACEVSDALDDGVSLQSDVFTSGLFLQAIIYHDGLDIVYYHWCINGRFFSAIKTQSVLLRLL